MLSDKFTRLNSSHRRALLAVIVIVTAVGLYRWLLAPFSGQLMAAQQRNLTLDSSIRKARILDTTLEAKKVKLDELTIASARLRNEFFTPNEASEFFASLPATIRQAGCAVQSVTSAPEQRSGLQNQTVNNSCIIEQKTMVTFAGGYGDIVKFLKEMQTYKRKVWIDSVKMETGGTAGKLKCQVTLMIYYIENLETALYE
jgi:Tfp pilus assembly protein PilO